MARVARNADHDLERWRGLGLEPTASASDGDERNPPDEGE
jgi:hypothetical protein